MALIRSFALCAILGIVVSIAAPSPVAAPKFIEWDHPELPGVNTTLPLLPIPGVPQPIQSDIDHIPVPANGRHSLIPTSHGQHHSHHRYPHNHSHQEDSSKPTAKARGINKAISEILEPTEVEVRPSILHVEHSHNGVGHKHKSHLAHSRIMRRQSSTAGRMTAGALQGIVTAGSALAGDKISEKLTGNDRDHPQKSKQQLAAEKAEQEKAAKAKKEKDEAEEKEKKVENKVMEAAKETEEAAKKDAKKTEKEAKQEAEQNFEDWKSEAEKKEKEVKDTEKEALQALKEQEQQRKQELKDAERAADEAEREAREKAEEEKKEKKAKLKKEKEEMKKKEKEEKKKEKEDEKAGAK